MVRARTSFHGNADAFWKLAHFVDELGSRYFAVKNRFVSAINDLVQPIEKQTWHHPLGHPPLSNLPYKPTPQTLAAKPQTRNETIGMTLRGNSVKSLHPRAR